MTAMTTKQTKRTTKRRGFTLAELSLVMVLAGSLMAIGVPKAVTLRRQMELDTAAHRLARDIKAAQHEAVRRNEQVSVTLVGNDAYTVGTSTQTRKMALPSGLAFLGGSPNTLTFAAFGPVVAGAGTYELKYQSARRYVVVNSSGMITIN